MTFLKNTTRMLTVALLATSAATVAHAADAAATPAKGFFIGLSAGGAATADKYDGNATGGAANDQWIGHFVIVPPNCACIGHADVVAAAAG